MPILSKSQAKFWASLLHKKERFAHQLFLVEGYKAVSEALESNWTVTDLVFRKDFQWEKVPLASQFSPSHTWEADAALFEKLSDQKNPEPILGVVQIPAAPIFEQWSKIPSDFPPPQNPGFLLDQVRDPGNLGTLIRTSDWFGFPTLYCAEGSVDCFNPKAIRASMGSLFHVNIVYIAPFEDLIRVWAPHIQAADMIGLPPFDPQLKNRPLILLGNEANGLISNIQNIPDLIRVTIPSYGKAESLNVAQAGSILAFSLRELGK